MAAKTPQRDVKKFSPYSKREDWKKNYRSPASPVYIPTAKDYTLFEEAKKSYGINSSEDKSKLEVREKHELFNEVSIPLNHSYSKIARLGIDVYNGFRPCLKIIKSGFNSGVYFTLQQFTEFLSVLGNMIEDLSHKDVGKYHLENYIVHTTDVNAVRFVPKNVEEKFQLYVGLSSLQTIRKMNSYFTSLLSDKENCDCPFQEFIHNVVNLVDVKKKQEACYEDLVEVLEEKYNKNLMLLELVHKLPNFMNIRVKDYMETYDDRFLYK
ncbi:hypothetical protein RN001_006023 [Aquatica leii]|uniref:Uncharacterized protein n=1 Tax=Aquatica leii TaxID=1421715 RepID=A0AAN7SJE4_9COLE|nr:hypothetical protein RN001_006023 [Aquatica leii]